MKKILLKTASVAALLLLQSMTGLCFAQTDTTTAAAVAADTRAADTAYFLNLLSKEQICIKNLVSHKTNYKDSPEAYKMLMKDRTQAMGVLIDWRD